jgi:hypothetical protein
MQQVTGNRLTIYLLSEDKGSIISKVKTGLNSFKDIKLPINEQSIAGFVATNKRVVNMRRKRRIAPARFGWCCLGVFRHCLSLVADCGEDNASAP